MPNSSSIAALMEEHTEKIELAIPAYLAQQRWFGGKSRVIDHVHIETMMSFDSLDAVLARLTVNYQDGYKDLYQLPLIVAHRMDESTIEGLADSKVLVSCELSGGWVTLSDATENEEFRSLLFEMASGEREMPLLASRLASAEQSNTSIVYGDQAILKLYRRLDPGENPDVEICRFLTNEARFEHIPAYLGELSSADGTTLAFLQEFVTNQGDGWEWMQDQLASMFSLALSLPDEHFGTDEYAATSLDAATTLGRCTAELHLALATETKDAAFAAEQVTPTNLAADSIRLRRQVAATLDALKSNLKIVPDEMVESAAALLGKRSHLLGQADLLATSSQFRLGRRIRIHGDYHLGQVLRAKESFIIVDFEGEPARALQERRGKQSPLRDVAGMLRSFSYAAASAWNAIDPTNSSALLRSVAAKWQRAAYDNFLVAYREAMSNVPELLPQADQFDFLLRLFLLEKALYELLYELNNRPSWIRIPLDGILSLLSEAS